MHSGRSWSDVWRQVTALVPEAALPNGTLRSVWGESWQGKGTPRQTFSPNDGTPLTRPLELGRADVGTVLEACTRTQGAWSATDLDERRRRVSAALDALAARRELFAALLAWEIGKPLRQARTEVDRTVDGVRWYLDEIEGMLAGRRPLGVVSNIASWNYPLSVLVHAMLVQALSGNAVIAKSPSAGGQASVTLAVALARRAGVPLSLVHGAGGTVGEALATAPEVAAVAFVGGRATGQVLGERLRGQPKRVMLEMEGVNPYGLWNFSDWERFEQHVRSGHDYAKQRCTAYPRFVVQRELFPQFLEHYLRAVSQVRVGHPLLDTDEAPLSAGPLIHERKVRDLRLRMQEATGLGAVTLYAGTLEGARLEPEQPQEAYLAPQLLLGPPPRSRLYREEPFGPVDTVMVVDRPEDLVREMNVSRGSLVATLATDDHTFAQEITPQIQAFKVGVNALRSRGDRDEPFGGAVASWWGPYLGGAHLVQAVTAGPAGEALHGNFGPVWRSA